MIRLAFVSVALFVAAPQAPPATDIYLAALEKDGDFFKLGQPRNITNHPAYDNQPFFTSDGSAVLFTSARGDGKTTDIYRYDIAKGVVARVTETPESEYSPTMTPGGRHMSVIRVEADGTQRLWQFTLDGREPSVVLPDVKPVGYHAWIDATTLALFVLGQPATLQIAVTGKAAAPATIASGIGRSIQRMPDGNISFVTRTVPSDGGRPSFTIMKLMRKKDGSFEAAKLVDPPNPSAEPDMAWTPDGWLLVASGGTLQAWRAGANAWRPIADLNALGIPNVSRLAVAPKGNYLALVAQPK